MKLIVPVGDLHCGARSGITPPDWQWPAIGKKKRWSDLQRTTWEEYKRIQRDIIIRFGRPTAVIFMGDLIDGPSPRTRGSTQVTSDVVEQAEMAATALAGWDAQSYYGVYGTGYHVGNDADWEDVVKANLAAESGCDVIMRSKLFLRIGDHVLQCKHHTGDSTTPYGWATPLAKEWVGNLLWWANDNDSVPRADIFLQAHVHAYRHVSSFSGGKPWHSVSLPGLQAAVPDLGSTRYARRLGLRVVHWGIVPILLDGTRVTFITDYITTVKPAKVEVISLD